jgi:tRNA-dihydrouridine synthase
MSKVPAHWDEIGKVVALRDKMQLDTVIIGNGDVKTMAEGKEKSTTYGVDGIMIGRGVFENIWLFKEDFDSMQATIDQRIEIIQRHLQLYEAHPKEKHPYQTLKKFFKIYIRDFDGAGELRAKLMETKNVEEAKEIINNIIINNKVIINY